MIVELDIFSGRRNPAWELGAVDRAELRRLQSCLNVANWVPPEPPPLGYRGFLYSDASGGVHVFRGIVRTNRAVLEDPSYTIERYLLGLLPTEFAGLKGRVSSAIGLGE